MKTDAKAKKRLPLLSSNKSAIVIKSNTYLVLGYLMLTAWHPLMCRLDGSRFQHLMRRRPEANNRCFAQGARLRTKSEHLMRRRPEAKNRCFARGARLRTKSEHLMRHRQEANNQCFAQGARLRTKIEHLMRHRPEANNRCFAQGARLRTKSEHLMRRRPEAKWWPIGWTVLLSILSLLYHPPSTCM
jgi:hypothetical protein